MTHASYDERVGQALAQPAALRDTRTTVRLVTPSLAQVTPLENILVLANYFMLLEIPDVRVSIYRWRGPAVIAPS